MPSRVVTAIRTHLFHDVPNDYEHYHELIRDQLRPGMRVLDVGCGRGLLAPFPWADYPNVTVDGLDPDPSAATNPALSHFYRLTECNSWPVSDGAYDLVVCRYVLEHLASPETFFVNLRCALKPGGRFIFLTPNVRHPAMQISRVLSHGAKATILGRTGAADEADVFPTCYRANSRERIAKLAAVAGLVSEHCDCSEWQPVRYGDFSFPTFLPALLFYEALHALPALDRTYGASITGVCRKPLQ